MSKLKLRDPDEVVERIKSFGEYDDMFGFRKEVLILALDFESAKQFLVEDAVKEKWVGPLSVGHFERAARDYYRFALDKIENHRGLSASRSIEKLREYAWLLGRDDVVEGMDATDYPQYGAPKVFVWAMGFNEKYPRSVPMVSMAKGLPCRPNCDEGCGR